MMSTAAATDDLAALIARLVRRNGQALLDDRGRLHGLLRDYAPEAARDIRLMMTAYDAGTVGRFQSEPPSAEALAREAATVSDGFGCRPDLARTAVETWARALAALKDAPSPAVLPFRPMPLPGAPAPLPGAVAPLPGASAPLPLPGASAPLPLPGSPAPASRATRIALVLGAVAALAALALRATGSF